MIRLARIATDPRWADALHRDLIRDQQTLDGIGWLGLKAYVDHSPQGTALREAFDGALTEHSVGVAQIVHAVEVLTWNLRGINSGGGGWDPYPQIKLPGVDMGADEPQSWADTADDDIAAMFAPTA